MCKNTGVYAHTTNTSQALVCRHLSSPHPLILTRECLTLRTTTRSRNLSLTKSCLVEASRLRRNGQAAGAITLYDAFVHRVLRRLMGLCSSENSGHILHTEASKLKKCRLCLSTAHGSFLSSSSASCTSSSASCTKNYMPGK
jgi:hypothetical protein